MPFSTDEIMMDQLFIVVKLVIGFVTNTTVPFSLAQLQSEELIKAAILYSGMVLMLIMSLIQRKCSVRDWLQQKPAIVRWVVFVTIFMLTVIAVDPISPEAGGFMYANF